MKNFFLLCCFCNFITGFSLAQSNELSRLKSSLSSIKDSLNYIDALNRIAMLSYEVNIDSTFFYTNLARDIANNLNYQKGKGDALNNLGVVFDVKGNLQLALRYYRQGYSIYTSLKDSLNCVQSQMNIAMVYKAMEKDDKSLEHFQYALQEGKKLRQDSILSLVIYNYLLAYPNHFNRDSLHYYIKKARNIAHKYNDDRTLLAIEQLIANDLIANGQRKKGMEILSRTITIAQKKSFFYASMDMMIGMGDHLVDTEPKRAETYYLDALKIATQNSYLVYSIIATQKLLAYYENEKDTNQSYHYALRLIDLLNEQQRLDKSSGIDYIDYILKEEELNALQLHHTNQRNLLFLVTSSLFLLFIILLMIRRNLIRSKVFNAKIIKQNENLTSALQALEQSQHENTKMRSIVAHDLRTPLGSISSISSLMLNNQERSSEDQEMLNLINKVCSNSLKLVDELLHLHTHITPLNKELIDLSEMLSYCTSMLSARANDKQQKIKLTDIPIQLYANRNNLWRVISNLISNAIKFSPEGSDIIVRLTKTNNQAIIAVCDEGIGIPKEISEKIFNSFTEAKRSGTSGEESFGLGLSISKQIIEAHNGKIWFKNNDSIGTTFFIELPLTG